MRNKRMYEAMQRMNDINAEWDRRKVEDATAEVEWEEYETLMYVFCEFVC